MATSTSSPKEIKLSPKKITAALKSPEQCAKAINLVYISDKQDGITRVKKGKTFSYLIGNKKITDKITLERIQKLVIPPAWTQVWICPKENGHLQATGLDALKRKQYRYHNLWNSFRNQTKFYRLSDFGKQIPKIRKQVKKDLAKTGLPLEKVLATVISLMEQTSIRIGNNDYEKRYGSYGLTTLKDKHAKIAGDKINFIFKGKKGVHHNITLKNKKLARIVKQCRDIPGKELFQYYDEDGNHKSIDSGMVNDYLRTITGGDFTTKDFRTWIGSVKTICEFRALYAEALEIETKTHTKQNLLSILDAVAAHLGNTRSVCKKYYIHPIIIRLCEDASLHHHLLQSSPAKHINKLMLSAEEKLLLHIIEQQAVI